VRPQLTKFMPQDMVVGKADDSVRLIRLIVYTEIAKYFRDYDRCEYIYTDQIRRQALQYIDKNLIVKHVIYMT
jgi:hypothetical protein